MGLTVQDGALVVRGESLGTGEGCCCSEDSDGGGDVYEPCTQCVDTCICIELQGHNFCTGNLFQDNCGGVFENCTEEQWRSLFGEVFGYSRVEYGAEAGEAVSYVVGFQLQNLICEDGQWKAFMSLASSVREFLNEPPFIRDRAFVFSPTFRVGENGCLVGINNGDAIEADPAPNVSSPLTPAVNFLRCPPPPQNPFA